ncbi:sulfur carrier protein ThiS [uncultured Sanguibacteroides sp.]|uniref:sulfur carrier protein ThiS n=1 Tax=uncultured Sanguibacteroides sp. TaxID=1635151 RepID=UPI0025E020AE|nr:sulfur carrier protein ThiS [uncultured Sanguibacteroides sp.]
MQIFINDKATDCSPENTLEEVLKNNGIPFENIAVAIDFSVIPKTEWGNTKLQNGNKIIIIKAVQGG